MRSRIALLVFLAAFAVALTTVPARATDCAGVISPCINDDTLWPETMIKDGQPLARSKARATFVDRTGLPGPGTWSNGQFPEGRFDHPVVGVSWYEAAAYARWSGKDLPSFAEWWRAALDDRASGFPWGGAGRSAEQRGNFGLTFEEQGLRAHVELERDVAK